MSVAIELIMQIEKGLADLSREYNLFLSDQVKVEPYEMREQLMAKVKRLRNLNCRRTEEQFRAANTVAKVQAHVQRWERQLELKYSGGPQRRRLKKKAADAPPAPKPKTRDKKSIVVHDAKSERDQVVALYDEYTRLSLKVGANKKLDFARFQKFIDTQTEKVRSAKQAKGVSYELEVRDEKVVFKTRALKE